MTDDDWDSCTDPTPMLEWLRHTGKATERKQRLFACACCRRIWHLLTDERSRKAVEVAERYADGSDDLSQLESAALEADEAARLARKGVQWPCNDATRAMTNRAISAAEAAGGVAFSDLVVEYATGSVLLAVGNSVQDEERRQCDLLRCVLSNPFRPLPPLDPSLLTWNDGVAVQLAQAVYEERILPEGHLDPAQLAVLADALEEAGAAGEILEHLRSNGHHVRGCAAIDAILDLS